MSPSGGRIGNGSRTFWLTEMRDCPKPCCSWARRARTIAWFPPASNRSIGCSQTQHCEINGHFVPIGSQGFYRQDGEKARFDQQPIEAAGAVSACLQAYRVTGDSRWRSEAWSAFNWFLGDNDLQLPLYDSVTGGCRDGLHPDRANENQGAESTLSFLMALLEMRSLQEPEQKEILS